MRGRFCDELPFAFGWIAAEPDRLQRASHALASEGRVWLVEPLDVDGLDERIRALGDVAGVIQLLDRHTRDAHVVAARYDVEVHEAFRHEAAETPFETVHVVDVPTWREAALWWPERRMLVVADALGTAPYFLTPGDAIGVHPLLRLFPPKRLLQFAPEHVLCGHGEGLHGPEAAAGLASAIRGAREGIPRWLGGLVRGRRRAVR